MCSRAAGTCGRSSRRPRRRRRSSSTARRRRRRRSAGGIAASAGLASRRRRRRRRRSAPPPPPPPRSRRRRQQHHPHLPGECGADGGARWQRSCARTPSTTRWSSRRQRAAEALHAERAPPADRRRRLARRHDELKPAAPVRSRRVAARHGVGVYTVNSAEGRAAAGADGSTCPAAAHRRARPALRLRRRLAPRPAPVLPRARGGAPSPRLCRSTDAQFGTDGRRLGADGGGGNKRRRHGAGAGASGAATAQSDDLDIEDFGTAGSR